jgi:RNA polymerase sigma factor (sigma-70 family)
MVTGLKAGALAMTTSPSETSSQTGFDRLLALRGRACVLAVRVLGRDDDAEDAVQKAYLDAIRRLRSGFAPDDWEAWFLAVVLTAAREQLRSDIRRRRRDAAVQTADRVRQGPGVDQELVGALGSCLAELDEEHRLPLSLCYEQGLSHQQAAAVLGIHQTTLSRHVSEGLELLRKALARAGYAALPAAVIAGLAHTAPPVPASLKAAVEKLVSGEPMIEGSSAAATPAAAKGGLAVKVIAGVVLAGALAGTIGLMGPTGPTKAPPPAEIKGPPKIEHYAGANIYGYLDGPKMGIMGVFGGNCDEQGNLYSGGGTRCIRASDGMTIRIVGGAPNVGKPLPPEGPACYISDLSGAGPGAYGVGTPFAVQGRPLDGGDKGTIYIGTGNGRKVAKVWKNKEKGDRWWYKEIAEVSGSVHLQMSKDDKTLYVCSASEVFRYENDKLVKVLDLSKFDVKNHKGGQVGRGMFVIGGDGNIYFGDKGEPGRIWRIPPDLSKAEEYGGGFEKPEYFCGPAKKGYWMCGPWIAPDQNNYKFIAADTLFPCSADENDLRRIRDGRISALCKDGEWRELDRGEKNQALYKFRAWTPGPNGTAYSYYDGAKEIRVYRITGIDYNKPTVGPQFQGK